MHHNDVTLFCRIMSGNFTKVREFQGRGCFVTFGLYPIKYSYLISNSSYTATRITN